MGLAAANPNSNELQPESISAPESGGRQPTGGAPETAGRRQAKRCNIARRFNEAESVFNSRARKKC
ncbi:hypothetical protein M7M4_12010 [Corynebacterium pseudogenitalium]